MCGQGVSPSQRLWGSSARSRRSSDRYLDCSVTSLRALREGKEPLWDDESGELGQDLGI